MTKVPESIETLHSKQKSDEIVSISASIRIDKKKDKYSSFLDEKTMEDLSSTSIEDKTHLRKYSDSVLPARTYLDEDLVKNKQKTRRGSMILEILKGNNKNNSIKKSQKRRSSISAIFGRRNSKVRKNFFSLNKNLHLSTGYDLNLDFHLQKSQ